MSLMPTSFLIFLLLLCWSEMSRGQSDSTRVAPAQDTPAESMTQPSPTLETQEGLLQGQVPQDAQNPPATQQNPQDPNLTQGQQSQTREQTDQDQDPNRKPNPGRMQDQQTETPMQGQGQTPAQGQVPVQPQNNQGQAETQDQLPPDAPRGQPLPKRPKVFPRPNPVPTASPTFTPAPPPPAPLPEATARPQPSGPKTAEQRAYESAMQTRWKAAADEIALLGSRGENLQGKKGKAFRESLRTAAGNRSMARTKLSQLIRGSSADFDKLKTGVERAFADLDASIEKVRSYFREPPAP